MRVSVVISTYNRANSLREALLALRYQTHPDFEVVVVAGPCTDDTQTVLGEFSGRVRSLVCPAVNLSVSRNIGIAASAGDLCAFIDDDSLADPYWLEQLAEGFDRPETVGVGGLVYDPTGFALQESPAVVDRRGLAVHEGLPPFVGNNFPGSDQFLHLLGTNCCLRRDTLRELGGFDEEYEYYLDETDICVRAIDAGGRLRRLDRAVVHHKFRASHLRNDQKVIRHPYPIIKNSYYFALKAARADDSTDAILTRVRTHVVEVLTANARNLHRDGRLSNAELAVFLREVDQGMRDGLQRGLNAPRRLATIPEPRPEAFLPFPTLRPEGTRRTICIASQDLPSERAGGIGRAAWTLATSMAKQGHDVHVLTRTPDHNRVDFEAGVWVHRLEPIAIDDDRLSPVVARNLAHAAAVHAEARRVAELRPLDAVVVPLWDAEGYFCLHDPSLPTVLTLQTSMHTMAGLDPAWRDFPEIGTLLELENACVTAARCIHGNTRETLAKSLADAGRPADACDAFVAPYGIADVSEGVTRHRGDDGKVRVLFVGRLEHRKGTDLLLAAAAELCHRIDTLEFVIVGDDAIPTANGETYRTAFEREHSDLAGRVRFLGKLDDTELRQTYADCDVFCLPARYESFGLVLIEAMAFGKPCVAFAVGGIPEVVTNEIDGLLADDASTASLTLMLERLVADPELRHRLGTAARETFVTKFHADRMANAMLREIGARAEAGMPRLDEWRGRAVRVAFVNSVLYRRDGISHAARLQMDLLRRTARANGVRLDLRAFCLATDFDDPTVEVVADGDTLAGHPFYRSAQVVVVNYGITSPIFDAIPFAPRRSRVVVCYQGVTRPAALSSSHQDLVHRSYRQLSRFVDADRFLASSDHTADDLDQLGIEPSRIGRLPATAVVLRADREPGRADGPLRLMYLGRFVPAKGVLDLIESVASSGLAVEIDLCGSTRYSDEVYLATLRERAAEWGVVARFHLEADESLVDRLMGEVHALIMPSRHEGFCIPVLDALSHGCPVIASDAGALTETGLGLAKHYPAGDVVALTARLRELDTERRDASTWADWLAECRARLAPFTESNYAARIASEVFDGLRPSFTPIATPLKHVGRLAERFRVAPVPVPEVTSAEPSWTDARAWPCAVRAQLRKLPVVGPTCRYLKRLIYLPWNFHILFTQFQQQMRDRR